MTSSSNWLTLLVLLVSASAAQAESPKEAEPLSLEEFRSRIEGRLPQLRRAEADLLMAEAAVVDARALPNLQLSVEREEAFGKGEAVDRESAVSLEWSLDISGRRQHRIRSAEQSVQALRKSSAYDKQVLLIGAIGVYYLAARARLRAQSLHASRAPIAALVETLENRVKEGDVSGYDLARFELQLSEHDAQMADARTELAVAQANLAALLGESSGAVIAASDLELAAAVPTSSATAGASRGDLLATRYAEESGRSLTRAASRWWIPTLDLSVGYLHKEIKTSGGASDEKAQGYTAMVTASIPVFSRGMVERKQGEARMRRAQVEREILARQIVSQVQGARTRLESRLTQTALFETRQLAFVATLAAKTETAYQDGEASAMELGDAYSKASEAQLRFIELRYLCRLAELALWSATGVDAEGVRR